MPVNVRAITPTTQKEGPQRIRELQVGDLINIIEGSEEREDPFKRRTQCDSVSILYLMEFSRFVATYATPEQSMRRMQLSMTYVLL